MSSLLWWQYTRLVLKSRPPPSITMAAGGSIATGALVLISNIPAQSTIQTRIFYTVVNVCAKYKTEMMSSLEIDVDSEHETPKEHVRSFLQVRFNVVPLLRRFAFASLIISTIKLKLSIINQLVSQATAVLVVPKSTITSCQQRKD